MRRRGVKVCGQKAHLAFRGYGVVGCVSFSARHSEPTFHPLVVEICCQPGAGPQKMRPFRPDCRRNSIYPITSCHPPNGREIMSRNRIIIVPVIVLGLAFLLWTPAAQATVYYWSTSSSTLAAGNGTWSTATGNNYWTTNSSGGACPPGRIPARTTPTSMPAALPTSPSAAR